MSKTGSAWLMTEPNAPLALTKRELPEPGPGEVRLQVQGCGLCHTDLGFLYGGVRTRKPLPLALGHEIVGTVESAGPGAKLENGNDLKPGQHVVVPAVLPCGDCAFCRAGRENACLAQKMPGNDQDGGFATHVTVPARFLVPIPQVPAGHELFHLAVVADAVTTPFQALLRGRVGVNDPVVVIGVGGVGMFGVQIAAAMGANVLAVDVDEARLAQAKTHGARGTIHTKGDADDAARKAVQEEAKKAGFPRHGWKVFEMSGTTSGQRLGFSLVNHGGTLGLVGFTRDKVEVRLSNLMALDADAFGSWGASPRHYPAVIDLIAQGKVQVKPFVTRYPLSEINAVLEMAHHGQLKTRPVLVPACTTAP